MSDNFIWAKSGANGIGGKAQSLEAHTKEVIDAAKEIFACLPEPDSDLLQDLMLSAALHDVGKAADGFQRAIRGENRRWGYRHEVISASFASACFPEVKEDVILALLLHHKGIIPNSKDPIPFEQIQLEHGANMPVFQKMKDEWLRNENLFNKEWEKIEEYLKIDLDAPKNKRLSEIRIDKRWFDSDSQRTIPVQVRRRVATLRGLLISADHIGSSHATIPGQVNLKDRIQVRPDAWQFQSKAGSFEGNVLIQAPTGSGKTEAALYWARRNQLKNGRLFYLLPFTASINAMYDRLNHNNLLGGKVGVLHSRAASHLYGISSEEGQEAAQRKARLLSSLAREMYFPVRICTPHQIMRYILRGRGWEQMLSEFPKALFVVDEIHAYDPRMTGLILGTINLISQWEGKVAFLSATVPSFLLRILEEVVENLNVIRPDDSIPHDRHLLNKERHRIRWMDGTIFDHIDDIRREAKELGPVLIVCNNVRTVQEVAEKLKEFEPQVLHSLMNARDRRRIETELVEGKLPRILVATQTIEVSLDIDFLTGFLEPAPVDALVQRLGRINRYGSRPPANVRVFEREASEYSVYDSDIVKKTVEIMRQHHGSLTESDLCSLTDEVYGNGWVGAQQTEFKQGLSHPLIRDFESSIIVGEYKDWAEELISSTDGTIEVLPSTLESEYNKLRKQGLWLEADSLLVPVGEKRINRLGIQKEGDHPPIVNWTYGKLGLIVPHERPAKGE